MVCQQSSLTKQRVSPACLVWPSTSITHRSNAARSAAGRSRRTTASIGPASEMTTLAGVAASIWAARVEPQRDMWKMKPLGRTPGSRSAQRGRSSTGVRKPNRRLNGRTKARRAVSR
jgi:hypothetical protein